MENSKAEKVRLNEELMGKVSGGDDTDYWCLCTCGMIMRNGVCPNPMCENSPNYNPRY